MFEQTFRNIDDVLWKEAGCASELDYTEQTSGCCFSNTWMIWNTNAPRKLNCGAGPIYETRLVALAELKQSLLQKAFSDELTETSAEIEMDGVIA